MNKFFKITMPDRKSFVVVSNGYAGLLGLVDNVQDKENTYVSPISLFEFVKYVTRGDL